MEYLQPDYSKIFASGAAVGEILNMPDESYLRGWGYLNASEPPPMEFFNYIMNGYDAKLYYLFAAGHIRKNSTRYEVGEIATTPNLHSKFELVCKIAGTTDATEPKWAEEETTISDGSCVWLIRNKHNAELLDGKDRKYFETLVENTAKIKKVEFKSSDGAWSSDGDGRKLVLSRDGYTCIAVYKVNGKNEEQVMSGIFMDADNINISSPSAFDGYMVMIQYTKSA